MDIAGKHIVITGAASGIGRAMAQRFHAEGAAKLFLVDLNEAPLKEWQNRSALIIAFVM